jgi:hypothetical protein
MAKGCLTRVGQQIPARGVADVEKRYGKNKDEIRRNSK